ncbi:plasmid recombination protein [Pseudoflavonifractor sp. DSM 107456]|uniref:Plasmid recombination protein n=1 Tax=Pseudoflavonifractor gallinarum TaxID=2779352 RepID=A0ABR9RCJ8_9FIRM|nr:MobV family relaxase [Pseudoflavonifractor gallinarum]MBE5056433.1 plasmid recombination protein [Pseudoflavonifractor gallinarum]
MSKPQYAILRFAKYKGPEIGNIEAHNERTKEKYASNPDVDISRSKYNFHLIEPQRKYRAEAERQIKEAGCRTRSDSVRVVEALITATPEFFQGKKKSEIRAYFQEALTFLQQNQDPKTIISAVVHMDEKTPHMHLSFVPLTVDGRLSAKEIVGNKKKLTQWQDKFWEHMVRKYPDLERGESASQTGRDHIPPRVFKEMTRLTKQKAKLEELLAGIGAFNAKSRAAEIAALLDKYIPAVEQMHSTLKKYQVAFTETTVENKKLKQENAQLEQTLEKATQESTLKQLVNAKLRRDYADAVAVLDRIPKEVLDVYTRGGHGRKERPIEQNL